MPDVSPQTQMRTCITVCPTRDVSKPVAVSLLARYWLCSCTHAHTMVLGVVEHRKQSEKEQRAGARAEQKKEAEVRLQASYSLVKRLAMFLPTDLTASRNNFRISAAGTPMGLVLGTSSFLKAHDLDAKEIKKLLYALEGGATEARLNFHKVCSYCCWQGERGLERGREGREEKRR